MSDAFMLQFIVVSVSPVLVVDCSTITVTDISFCGICID